MTDVMPTGLWAGPIGTRRLLKLFDKYNIKASWFIPGHTLESFPEECALVRDAGHEIGVCSVPLRLLSNTDMYSFMDTPMRILQT